MKINHEEIQNDIDKFGKLDALKHSEGGKLLTTNLKDDIINSIDTIIGKYKEATHIELIAIIARLEARLTLLRTLTRSEENKKLAKQELEKIILEE